MPPPEQLVSLRSLTSACVYLAAGAGALIRGVAGPGSTPSPQALELVTKEKDNTPQTVADRHAQRHIVSGLRAVAAFAHVAIVGEEGGEEQDASWSGAPTAELSLLEHSWPESADEHVAASDVTVWIDPLDGTKEFTAGRYEFCTTLIGITVRGEPQLGIISAPYAHEGRGRVLWGGRVARGVFEFGHDGASRELAAPADDEAARSTAVASLSRSTGAVDEALAQLQHAGVVGQRLQVGGAGCKALSLLTGVAAYWIFPCAGTSRWDTCAAQALLEAVGGALVDRAGLRLVYDASASEHGNLRGVIAVRDGSKVAGIVRVTAEALPSERAGDDTAQRPSVRS